MEPAGESVLEPPSSSGFPNLNRNWIGMSELSRATEGCALLASGVSPAQTSRGTSGEWKHGAMDKYVDLIASWPDRLDPRVVPMGSTMTGVVELCRRRCPPPAKR
jgi:hypothetical protein